jgi:hypothetical protein
MHTDSEAIQKTLVINSTFIVEAKFDFTKDKLIVYTNGVTDFDELQS